MFNIETPNFLESWEDSEESLFVLLQAFLCWVAGCREEYWEKYMTACGAILFHFASVLSIAAQSGINDRKLVKNSIIPVCPKPFIRVMSAFKFAHEF